MKNMMIDQEARISPVALTDAELGMVDGAGLSQVFGKVKDVVSVAVDVVSEAADVLTDRVSEVYDIYKYVVNQDYR